MVEYVTPWPSTSFLRCLYCHYVLDDQLRYFAEMLNVLRQFGEFVDTDRVVAMVDGRAPVDGRYFHLSFDDGFRSVIRNAVPILKQLNVPAIVFVPSDVIGASYERARVYSLQTLNRRAVMEVATWDDLKRLLDDGIAVGSHTRTHARLSEIVDRNQLWEEISGSKQEIEERLGIECKYISWPYGTDADINRDALDSIRKAGYRACFSAVRGAVTSGKDPMRIPRDHFEMHWPLSHIMYFCKANMGR